VSHQITVQQLSARLESGAPTYLVDVRQPWEHDLAALPGNVLLPIDQLPARLGEIAPPDGALIVVYCHHGIRSQSGAALLRQAGFPDVVSLAGGVDAWARLIDPKMARY
jgi:rhodanese-related sulfurtransferase